jgi:iron complex outermembrane recepter protein
MARSRWSTWREGLLCAGASAGLFALTAAAIAENAVDSGAPAEGTALEEVVVTALRRETKLIDTPVAVSVITADEIQRQRITEFYSVAEQVPNMTFTQVTRQEAFVSIRGTQVGNDTPGSDMGVAVFLDGVPRTGVHDYYPELFDLQGIEVLRGPQGTLFGRNTTGGAILIHTAPPSFQPFYKAQLTYGNYNLGEFNGLLAGPLVSDVLAGKLAFNLHRRDGYVDNVTLNRKDGAEKAASVRGQLLWVPVDDVRALFGVDYLRDRSESRVGSLEATFQPSLFPTLRFGPDFTNEALPPRASNTIVGALVNVDWTTSIGTVTSISGFRSVESQITYSAIADPYNSVTGDQRVDDRQFSEELHLASKTGGRLTWLVGLFYLHLNRSDGTFYSLFPVPGTAVSFAIPPGATSLQQQEVLTTSAAGFGEASYRLLEPLTLTLGARYSSERRSGNTEIIPNPTNIPGYPVEVSGPYAHSWSAFTPKGTLTFKPNHEFMTYATVAKGFQSGGFDAAASTPEGLRTPFSPETVWSYELGLKTQTLERRLSFNAALFLADYQDLQRTAFDSNPTVNAYRTTNAGKARVKGIETEASYAPAKWLTLSVDYAYTDAKYREYLLPQSDGTVVDYSGNVLPQTPRQQWHVAGEVTMPWPATRGELIAGADYTYRSAIQFTDANDTPSSIIDKTRYDGIVNLRAQWRSLSGEWSIDLFAKNVTDKRALVSFPEFTPYYANLQEYGNPQDHVYLARYSPVRSFGISFTVAH